MVNLAQKMERGHIGTTGTLSFASCFVPPFATRSLSDVRLLRADIGKIIIAEVVLLQIVFLTTGLLAADPQKTFEVASVRASPDRAGEDRFVKFDGDEGRIAYRNISLRLLVSMGWDTPDSRIVLPEEWMTSAPYDVSATFPAGASKADLPAMLQALVTERFQLLLHHEQRTVADYELVIGKQGSRLKQAAPDGAGSNYMLRGRIEGPQMPMRALAEALTGPVGKPVVDATKLAGVYDVHLRWAPDDGKADVASDANGGSIFTAVQEQLGLQLVPKKQAVDYLVIDRASRTPTGN